MKTKYLISSLVLISGILITASAVAADIQYPIPELGNCQNEAACKTYCDKPGNTEVCITFAEKNNLMSPREIAMAKKFLEAGGEGPGGCEGKDACEEYCNDISHIDECLAFAEENNLASPEELEEAHKVQAAIARGVKPPPCGNKKSCDVYCDNPEHMEECIAFGIEAGFIQGKELEDVQKMLAAVKRGVKPPPCKGKEACDVYCQEPEHMEICMNFALEAGFMTEQEKDDSQKMLAALKKGVKPPACKGKEECDVYCSQDEHMEECMNFAEAAGFMSPEEAAMARKTGGKGPGGCKGKEECEAFCNNPDNQETCFNFGKEHGMIPEEDLKIMEEGKSRFRESLNQAPPAVIECLNSSLGSEMMEKFRSGSAMPPREIGDQMRQCFEKIGPLPGLEGPPGQIMPPGQVGPGGCKGPEECQAYCESHPEECQKFQPGPGAGTPGGPMMPPQAGPGGCKTKEECQAYCLDPAHTEECSKSGGGQGQICLMVLTPAKDPQTGRCVIFGSSCIPPGWVTISREEAEKCEQEPMKPPEGIMPQQEGTMPPEGMMQPPEGMIYPQEMMPPPEGIITPPPEQTPPPPSPEQISPNLLQIFLNFLRGK